MIAKAMIGYETRYSTETIEQMETQERAYLLTEVAHTIHPAPMNELTC